jgi:hypothetical protein
MSEKERAMSDIREALVEIICDAHDRVEWTRGPWASAAVDAILAEFDVTERGEGEQPFERDDSCGYCGRVHSDFAACFEGAPVPTPPTVKPSVEDVARALYGDDLVQGRSALAWEAIDVDEQNWYRSNARAVLALFEKGEGRG